MSERPIRFACIGLDHAHIFGMTGGLLAAGAELVGITSDDPNAGVLKQFQVLYPDAPWFDDASTLLDDPSIDLIATAAIPVRRGEISLQALRAGKDVLSDKPGVVSHEQLAAIEKAVTETGRFWDVVFSERFEVKAAIKAGELVHAGRIGRVVQTLGLGPHREGDKGHLGTAAGRPDWFYDIATYGGILNDIASHQIDQFLWYTGSTTAKVVTATVANFNHPATPTFQDFGELLLSSEQAQGYVRVDWFTPAGLPTWGDGRLTILGTDGYIELRKYVDIEGRPGGDHVFLVDNEGTHYFDCSDVELTFHADVLHDVRHRTQTAVPQAHTFEVSRLGVTAQSQATVLNRFER